MKCKYNGCTGLTSVTIGSGVNSIGSYAFSNCSGLTKAEFASIESLCKIKFSDSKSNPLYYAKHLYINGQEVTDVIIPNSVTSIGSEAFRGCSGLTSVTCHAQNVPSTDSDVFDGVPQSTATLYVPKESIDAYKSTSPWSSFGTILPITPTAVESLIADEVSDEAGYTAIYDLNGRRLQHKPAHGFYIQGGKKYFVK